MSRMKRTSMITDSNQVCYAKMLGCRVQEESIKAALAFRTHVLLSTDLLIINAFLSA